MRMLWKKIPIEKAGKDIELLKHIEHVKKSMKKAESRKLIGSYATLAKNLSVLRKRIDKDLEDSHDLYARLEVVKKHLENLHERIRFELGYTKEAYKEFAHELLYLATKIAELEELIASERKITSLDLKELRIYLHALENKLFIIEKEEFEKRKKTIKLLKRTLSSLMKKRKKRGILDELRLMEERSVEIEKRISAKTHKRIKLMYRGFIRRMRDMRKMKRLKSIRKNLGELLEHVKNIEKVERIY